MSAITTIISIMPLIQQAAGVITSFVGDDDDKARADKTIQDALEIIGAVAPLVDAFSRGQDVTPDDVRASLAGMDSALGAFDAEIAKQGG